MRAATFSFVAWLLFALDPTVAGAITLEYEVPDCGYPCNGDAVAIDGDTAALTTLDTLHGTVIVSVLVKQGGEWTWQADITDPVESDGSYPASELGTFLALQGDTLLVTATPSATYRASRVVVFQRTNGVWSRVQTLNFLGTGNGVAFTGLVLRGGTAAIGVLESARSGRVYLFERRYGLFMRQAEAGREFMGRDGSSSGAYPLAFDGSTLVIGSTTEDDSRGAAYVYGRSGTGWSLQQKLTDATASAGDRFGNSVAVSGDTLAVGRYGPQLLDLRPKGQVSVYARSSGTWTLRQTLKSPGPVLPDYMFWSATFGDRLALEGTRLVTSADYPFDRFFAAPGAHVFEFGAGAWRPVALLYTGGPLDGVALSGSRAIMSGDSQRWANTVFIYNLSTP